MADNHFRVKRVVSAGGVVYRHRAGDLEVLLLETPTGEWGLPKGTPNDGETLSETACREVCEETGLRIAMEEKIGRVEYWFGRPALRQRLHKYVHFWLMRPVGGSILDHDHEHISVRWFPVEEALRRVTHDTSADMIEQAAVLLAARAAAPAPEPGG